MNELVERLEHIAGEKMQQRNKIDREIDVLVRAIDLIKMKPVKESSNG